MVIQPIYNILFLPDVTYHFKKEFFTENASEQLEVGSELLFAFLRNEDDAEELDADHICPVGISARVEAFGDDDSVQTARWSVLIFQMSRWKMVRFSQRHLFVQRLMTIRQKKRRLNFSVYVPHF